MKKLKIRTKIMLWFTLLSTVLLGTLVPTVYTMVAASLRQTLQANLQMTISQVFSSVESQNGRLLLDLEEIDLADGTALCILSQDGTALYKSQNAAWLAEMHLYAGEQYLTADGKQWAVQTQHYEIDDVKMTVIAAGSMDYVTESLNDLILLLLILVPVYLLISAVGAFFLAKRAMRPIRQITKTAQAIESGDMAQRIHDVDSKDEVGELADTFNGMLDTLEVSFQRERQFTSDASHELRTPITVIATCTEDALGDNGAVNCLENLETIKGEAARMTKIISQLLMLSRGYEGRCHFEPDRICLYDMVDSVSEELKDTAEEMCISIHNDVGKNIDVTADQSLMTQLFVNLIGNAVKYGSAGGNVWLNAREQNGQLHIEVSDDGIGISEDDQTHIFERFYRADKARDRTGSGLGLAIVKWIVDLHSGAIGVKSSLGHGTTFEITLPNK